MEPDQLREMTDEELQAKVEELKEEQSNLRMQQAVTTLENPMRLRHIQKTVARIKTVLRERELEEAEL